MSCIAKRFGSTLAGRRQRTGEIAQPQAGIERSSTDKVVQKSCVKAVAGPDRINRRGTHWRRKRQFSSSPRYCAFLTALHDDERNMPGKYAQRSFRIALPR